jgi:hypothetical protein
MQDWAFKKPPLQHIVLMIPSQSPNISDSHFFNILIQYFKHKSIQCVHK